MTRQWASSVLARPAKVVPPWVLMSSTSAKPSEASLSVTSGEELGVMRPIIDHGKLTRRSSETKSTKAASTLPASSQPRATVVTLSRNLRPFWE